MYGAPPRRRHGGPGGTGDDPARNPRRLVSPSKELRTRVHVKETVDGFPAGNSMLLPEDPHVVTHPGISGQSLRSIQDLLLRLAAWIERQHTDSIRPKHFVNSCCISFRRWRLIAQ